MAAIGDLWRKMTGGGQGGASGEPIGEPVEYGGFTLRAAPRRLGGQWQVAGVIEKEIDGAVRTYEFVRADMFGDKDSAVEVSISKARRLVDEQGERLFGETSS